MTKIVSKQSRIVNNLSTSLSSLVSLAVAVSCSVCTMCLNINHESCLLCHSRANGIEELNHQSLPSSYPVTLVMYVQIGSTYTAEL